MDCSPRCAGLTGTQKGEKKMNEKSRSQRSQAENRSQTGDGKQILGRQGEELAACLLAQNGYEILARNYRCPYGEIDLIAQKDGVLTFTEVKTRQTDRFGQPAEAVTREKQKKIRLTAIHYLGQSPVRCSAMEFQVIEISVRSLRGLTFQEAGLC